MSELLTGIRGLFFQQATPRDFNCARVYRGEYSADTNQYAHPVVHSFRVIHGDAEIRPGKLLRMPYLDGGEGESMTDLETFYIFPKSEYVRVAVKGVKGERILTLFRAEPGGKSRMWKERVDRYWFELVDPVKGE